MQCGIAFVILFFYFFSASAQNNYKSEFHKLSCPEKRWVIFHPFIAKKAFLLTNEARSAAKEMGSDSLLDGDENGGQVDAFRHAYWMALLSENICWRKAKSLGKAHEKGNYREFKKHRLEEGTLPDSVSGEMDLFNNEVGIKIGRENKTSNGEELKIKIRDAVIGGKMIIIKKSISGEVLDCKGNIINLNDYVHQWNIPKCLIRSDHRTGIQ